MMHEQLSGLKSSRSRKAALIPTDQKPAQRKWLEQKQTNNTPIAEPFPSFAQKRMSKNPDAVDRQYLQQRHTRFFSPKAPGPHFAFGRLPSHARTPVLLGVETYA